MATAGTNAELPSVPPETPTSAGTEAIGKTSDKPTTSSVNAGTAAHALLAQTATAPTVLPSSNADYLNNPAPSYPAISRRLGEQGKVVIRVLIGRDGNPLQAELHQTSGYARLDQAALRAVMGWRYVPGRQDGKSQDMWFNVPINFSLN